MKWKTLESVYARNNPIITTDSLGLWHAYPGTIPPGGHFEREMRGLLEQAKREAKEIARKNPLYATPKDNKTCVKIARQFRDSCYIRGTAICELSCIAIFKRIKISISQKLKIFCQTACEKVYHYACDVTYNKNLKWCKEKFCTDT
jgi:hypothetical protein